jgi:hypothetical protein
MNTMIVRSDIQARQIRHFLKAHVRYGRGVMDALCFDSKTVQEVEEPEGGGLKVSLPASTTQTSVVIRGTRSTFAQEILTGQQHRLTADEPSV